MCEATASWKWFNWLLAQLPPNKQPLLLNMDETACRLFYDPAKGVLASELVALAARRGRVTSSVTTAQTRSVLSLVALLCNDSSIQPRLPQYILGNEHVLQTSALGELRRDRSLSPNVHILRRKSAWVNDAELAGIARHWSRVLQQHCPDRQPILLLDACSAHLGPKFLASCVRCKIWVVYVPARLTWLLQPADTHCFALLKASLRQLFHDTALRAANGKVTVKNILEHLDRAIRKVFQGRSWSDAFEGNGWSCGQRQVRQRILDTLEWPAIPEVDSCLPSLQDFQTIFPRNRWIPLAKLLGCHRVSSSPAEPPLPPPVHPPAEAAGRARNIWHGRLRSSSHHVLPSPAAILTPRDSGAASSSGSIAPATWPPSAPVPKPAPSRAGLLPRGRPLLRPRKRARVAVDEA